jgi:hypothetical protein
VVFCCRARGGTAAMSEKTTKGNLLERAKPLDQAYGSNDVSPCACFTLNLFLALKC